MVGFQTKNTTKENGVRVRHGRIDVVGHSDKEYEKENGVRVRHGSIDVVGHWRGHGRNRGDRWIGCVGRLRWRRQCQEALTTHTGGL